MLTEVMRFYGLARPPVDAGFFETEHHAQVSRDIRAAIMGGRLIALTAVIGSGKTILSRRLRADLEREGRVIVSRSLSIGRCCTWKRVNVFRCIFSTSPIASQV